MNIISLSKDRFNTPQKNLVFSANQKAIQKRMIQSLSENLLSNTMYSTDVVELSTIIKDPKKNKIFFCYIRKHANCDCDENNRVADWW